MGIVNVTPDSFSDGGRYDSVERAVAHAEQLIKDGADLLDVGGESTRPGAQAVDADTEWARIGEVIRAVSNLGVPVSVDTMKPMVMEKALEAGASILNDVNGFRAEGALEVLAASGAKGIVMHMQGEPRTMQSNPVYQDVVAEVASFLTARLEAMSKAGVNTQQLWVDPGFGFGKTLEHNLALLRSTTQFAAMGAGVLVGVSRKRMIGELTGQSDASARVHGSVAAALFAASQGAQIVRVHDVRATADAMAVWLAASGEIQ